MGVVIQGNKGGAVDGSRVASSGYAGDDSFEAPVTQHLRNERSRSRSCAPVDLAIRFEMLIARLTPSTRGTGHRQVPEVVSVFSPPPTARAGTLFTRRPI